MTDETKKTRPPAYRSSWFAFRMQVKYFFIWIFHALEFSRKVKKGVYILWDYLDEHPDKNHAHGYIPSETRIGLRVEGIKKVAEPKDSKVNDPKLGDGEL